MVVSRSSAKTTNMYVSQEIREYISELVKPLATNNILEDIFKKLKEEIIFKLEEKFDNQNQKINELEGKIAIQSNTIEQLIIECYDNEQYSRRSCLRIHRIEYSDNVLQQVKECYE